MRGIRETITRWTRNYLREQPPHPAAIAGLYLLCISLIWFLPGFLAPELFGGGNTYPFIIFEYGGVYLLAAVLFGCSAALLFALARKMSGPGVRAFALPALAVALLLLYPVPAYLGGSMQMILPFYVPGWNYFGLSHAADVLMSAVISFSGIGLLSLATIAPILLIDRYVPMKRPYAAAAALGTLLFPILMAAIFRIDPVPSLIPWLSLSLSTLSVLCLGVAGAAVLSVPLVVRRLLKGGGNPPQQARVFGLLLLCLLLVWFVPGYLEPGLFLMGHDYPDPGLKMKWFIPYDSGDHEYSRFAVPTIEGNYLIDEDRFLIRPPASPLSGTALRAVYTREHTGEQYVVDQWWYNNQRTFRDEKMRLLDSLTGSGEISETTLDLGDHLLAAGFERSDAERKYPAWLFVNETARGYILTYERPFDDGRSNDFFIVYYGTFNTVGPDPDRSLKALIAERLSPSAIRAPGEGLDEGEHLNRMPEAKPFLYISEMIRYAGILLLTPFLFGCSAALLFAGALTELETQKRRLAVAIPLLAAVLLFLSLISGYLTGSTWMPIPPFYLPTSEPFGVSTLLDALLNLMLFLSALTLIGLGVIAPYLLLRRYLPLKRPFRAVLVSGTLVFGILIYPLMMMLAVWDGLRPAPGISPLVWIALGFCLAAAWAVVIYAVQAAAGRGGESP